MLESDHYLTVTDLKQYSYCQRVIFYERCLPHIRPRTYKMEAGKAAHEDEQERAQRRSLRQYDQLEGQRLFEVRLASPTLELRGIVDEVVLTDTGLVIPVDYKMAKSLGQNHRVQLMAYAMLLEEQFGAAISEGYVYLIPKRQTVKVKLKPELRQTVLTMLVELRQMIAQEAMPAPTSVPNQCVACEFRRFCNDV
jgi:CRISPR-associated exonuclease Cas4